MLLASSTKPEREGEDKGNKEERGAQREREKKTKTRKKEEKRDKGWQTLRAWSLEDNVSLKSAHLRIKKALK